MRPKSVNVRRGLAAEPGEAKGGPRRLLRMTKSLLLLTFIVLMTFTFLGHYPALRDPALPDGSGVLIVDGLSQIVSPIPTDIIKLANDTGPSVHYVPFVTVEQFRWLSSLGYSVFVLRFHSGPSWIGLPENYSSGGYPWEQINGQVQGARVVGPGGESTIVAVTFDFVKDEMLGTFPNKPIVILAGCSGLEDMQLAAAFVSKGAATFVGWDGQVTLRHSDSATLVLLQKLIVGKESVFSAVPETMSEIGPDPVYASHLKYFPNPLD